MCLVAQNRKPNVVAEWKTFCERMERRYVPGVTNGRESHAGGGRMEYNHVSFL